MLMLLVHISNSNWVLLQMIATDTLDLGCTIFEKAATEKAIREIDERLIQQYTSRAKAKNSNQQFFDQSQLQVHHSLAARSFKPKLSLMCSCKLAGSLAALCYTSKDIMAIGVLTWDGLQQTS